MIITLVKADFSANNIGMTNSFAVLTNLGTGLRYEGPTSVMREDSFSATITVNDFYKLDSIMVMMGGEILDNAYSINNKIITLNIESVTGIIAIVGAASQIGMLLNLDFTKHTLEDYVNSGIIYNYDNGSVLEGTYDENGLTLTNRKPGPGYCLTDHIAANQNLWMEFVLTMNPYDNAVTDKAENMYPYFMLLTGVTDDGHAHGSNCFTPAVFSNGPKLNIRDISGTTGTANNTQFLPDGISHSYKLYYDATAKEWTSWVDGVKQDTIKREMSDEGHYGTVLGAHTGYPSNSNYGLVAGIVIKSLKIWTE